MRHWVLGIIALCAVVSTEVASAQDAQDFDQAAFANALLADIGVTEMELMQFGGRMEEIARTYGKLAEEYTEIPENPTRDNYAEWTGIYFDNLLQPMFNDAKIAATEAFTEESYSKMMLRLYQIAEYSPGAFRGNDVALGGLFQLFVLPDVVPMTEEQLAELFALQKEIITDMVGLEVILKEEHAELFAEQEALFKELEKAETDDEKAVVQKKLNETIKKTAGLMNESMQKMFAKSKGKPDTLLTAEQKAKLAQIKQDMPDYLKKALAQLQAAAEKSEVSAAWRPGINSWMPGHGAPRDRTGHPGETRPEKTPKGRQFPE